VILACVLPFYVRPRGNFYLSRRIALITGSAGFIGSHLVESAVEAGYQVRAFVHYNSAGSRGWLEGSRFRDEIEVVAGDIRDFDSVSAAVNGCDAVFHLAALIGIPYSYASPLAYIRTNVEGTYNILETTRRQSTPNVLITSTSETYGTARYVPINEDHPAQGQSPYAATKIAADELARSYWLSFELPVKIVRPFNTYGPRQSARAIIPTIIGQIASGERVIKLGNLSPTRDLTFVRDTVAAFLAVAECERCVGMAVNAGSNEEISIGDLALKIATVMGVKVEVVHESQRLRPEGSEVQRLRGDNTRIRELTGWGPKCNLDAGLMETVEWFANNPALYKPAIYAV
jgi:NAD dependent epimerase/dehydratase